MFNKTLILALSLSIVGSLVQLIFSSQSFFLQFGFTVFGLIIYWLLQKIELNLLCKTTHLISLLGITLLVVLLLFGDPTRGARRWFFIFGFGLQPSIFFLPFFLLSLTLLLSQKPINKKLNFLIYLVLIGVIIFLVFRQPDLGTSLVLAGCFFSVLLFAGGPVKYFGALFILIIPLFILSPHFLKPYQLQRINAYLNPGLDPSGANYNSLQAEIAIGSGGFFGKGFSVSQSRMQFLPEAHTDFLFAAFVESFGFGGGLILLACYFFFLESLLQKAFEQKDNFLFSTYSLGVFVFIFGQFVFNIGMNLRLLPVVGVPLPLLSYGGSTILTVYLLFAIAEKLKTG